ncbi:pyruvate dehydrogenase complex dihydrolipoamide acetyltransferase [Bartonella sp. TP]|uniref:pyruvate dehydrogenase complex dihydrolipoamide acetyltransferase n=1 Tax=Bartonella sp. TP TaxID=3057550 RepID=UPI0025B1C1D0|nr:pyruvate dehydrogenase complex dihydrolipoamide acetyltransferase [Bartonella sp. TP]WJW80093.1 pyruvate dehydrogenase complex dihydrolipoamide acetyltransferase [Bartonella sp. TP]
MSIEILMPALSPTMESGKLGKWLKNEGDAVKIGETIAEIETDKATMELESIEDGILAKILVPAGSEGVRINSVIAILAQEGEKLEDYQVAKAAAPIQVSAAAPLTNEPAIKAAEPIALAKTMQLFSSPLARRLAKENAIELKQLQGTGAYGRIVKRDVEAFLRNPQRGAVKNAETEDKILELYEQGEYELVPHDSMRQIIASRLSASKQSVPHFYMSVDCELDKLIALRKELNSAAPMSTKEDMPAYKLSINDFIIKAVANSLMSVPEANVSWLSHAMLKHKSANIGVAVAIENGLITPIVKSAEKKSIVTISNEMKDLITRAKAKKLKPLEYQGGSAAISNLGMYGIKEFSAILNPPQSVIFAIGAADMRAIVKNDSIIPAKLMTVTISADHRAINGADAAKLIQAFKWAIEHPYAMLV